MGIQNRLESVASAALALAAICIAAAFIHREVLGTQRPPLPTAAMGPPEHLAAWEDMLRSGIGVGNLNAPVKILEFGDFECPACRSYERTIHRVAARFRDDVAVVFVHFPLQQHHFARPAARAAECANDQGRFVELHDLMYSKQDSLGLKSWASFAREAGVRDSARFARCVSDTSRVLRIEAGLALGSKIGIRGTPTIVINGWRFPTTPSESTLTNTVSALIEGRQPFAAQRARANH